MSVAIYKTQSFLFEFAWKKMKKFLREKALRDLSQNPGIVYPRDITRRQESKLAHS
jgi:hypothetical protein